MSFLALTLTALSFFAAPAQAAGDATAGKNAYAVCTTCHGAKGEGNKALNAPALAGQQDWYLERQLKNYKAGVRGKDPKDTYGMQMAPMAMTLATDQAVADVVAYIGTLPAANPAPTLTGDAAKGKTLYTVCATCHGADGKGVAAMNAPTLVALPDWYVQRQLQNYKSGARGKHPQDAYGMKMADMVQPLTDEQAILDVTAYLNSL